MIKHKLCRNAILPISYKHIDDDHNTMEMKNFSKNVKNFINEKIFQNDENNYVSLFYLITMTTLMILIVMLLLIVLNVIILITKFLLMIVLVWRGLKLLKIILKILKILLLITLKIIHPRP